MDSGKRKEPPVLYFLGQHVTLELVVRSELAVYKCLAYRKIVAEVEGYGF